MTSMKKLLLLSGLFLLEGLRELFAIQRFPKPEFESGYQQPETFLPSARMEFLAYLDVAVLILALSFISWLVIRKRSRIAIFWTSMASLAYFGFYREGCVCSIGAIQNVSLSIFDPSYAIPVTVLAFFLLPLFYTLLFGRTFCAGVCPFGALQDLVAFKPLPMGVRLNTILGVLPYIYLGLSVLYAATGTDFIICRYDPFVGIFRMNASFGMFLFAGTLLLSGVFIARPYCRFLCPYGVILNWLSRFSWKHLTITPSKCIQCRLCEGSCPYDAIEIPVTGRNPETRTQRARKIMILSILLPLFILAGTWLGLQLHEPLASVNPKVKLAREIISPSGSAMLTESFEIQAFKSAGKLQKQALDEALQVLAVFRTGSMILGGFIGLVFGLLIAGRMLKRHQPDYVPNKGRCYSCARCVDFCPVKE